MRAIQVAGPGDVSAVELAVPTPSEEEALVRVGFVGLCSTDRKLAARGSKSRRVPGHEISGWTSDGAAVGVHPDVGCGICGFCRTGFHNRCPDRTSIGIDRDGGMAEYLTVPKQHVMPISSLFPRELPLLEPLACCLHAVDMLGIESGEIALVVGAGTMGLLAMWALQSQGVRVVVSQRSEARRRVASELGADAVIGMGEDVRRAFGESPVAAIVTAPTAEALAYALVSVAVGGRVHSFAGMPVGGEIDANVVHYRHLTLMGSTGSRMADYRLAADLAGAGRIDLSRLPTKVVTLEEVPRILVGESEPDGLKVLIAIERSV